MPWVTFVAAFDFSPAALGGRVTIAYRSGTTMHVTRECAERAIAAGRAAPAANPRRKKQDDDPDGSR